MEFLEQYGQYILLFIVILTGSYFIITYLAKYLERKRLVNVLGEASELQKSGDLSGALDKLEDNLKRYSFKDPIFASYISFLIANFKFEKAKGLLEDMQKDPAEEFSAVNMLGYIATIEEKFEDAERHYKKALELDPTKKKAIYTNLAVIYAEQGIKLDDAINMLNEVLSIEDGANKYPVYINLGYAQFKKGLYEDALANESIGLELIPKGESLDSIRAFAHYVKGLVFRAQNKKDDAKSEFMISRQLSRNPGFQKKIQKELDEIS